MVRIRPRPTQRLAALLCSLALFAMGSVPALASMELSNVIYHFEAGEASRQDVEIYNTGEEPLYIDVVPTRVLSPGTEQEDRAPIVDPREAGLLVTPNKMIVPAGGTKVMRLVKMGGGADERVYRIAAKPVARGVEADESGLKIMIGYEILAIVYPNNTQPQLDVLREGTTLKVRNVGNTNVLLREGFQCEIPGQALEDCTPLPGKRMYPGNEWTLELPRDLPVTYYQSIGTRNFVETWP